MPYADTFITACKGMFTICIDWGVKGKSRGGNFIIILNLTEPPRIDILVHHLLAFLNKLQLHVLTN